MRVIAIFIFVAAVVATPRTAAACQCYDSTPFAVPDPGTVVPTQPTFYVFVPRTPFNDEHHDAEVRGVPFTRRLVTRSSAFQVWRIDVLATAGSFELELDGYDPVRYTIGPTPQNHTRIIGVEQTGSLSEVYGCTTHIAFDFETTGTAIAYRFAWSDGTSTILPAYRSQYAPNALTALGRIGCDDGKWNDDGLAQSRAFVMFALFADGSEHKLGSSTAWLGPNGSRVPIELANAKVDPPRASRPPPPMNVEVTTWWRQMVAASAGMLVVAALLGLVAFARSRRRKHVARSASR
jgi:hypothetical protein